MKLKHHKLNPETYPFVLYNCWYQTSTVDYWPKADESSGYITHQKLYSGWIEVRDTSHSPSHQLMQKAPRGRCFYRQQWGPEHLFPTSFREHLGSHSDHRYNVLNAMCVSFFVCLLRTDKTVFWKIIFRLFSKVRDCHWKIWKWHLVLFIPILQNSVAHDVKRVTNSKK